MMRDSARQGRKPKRAKAIGTQEKLYDALKLLFDLLETYAPVWYEKRYHDQAEAALKLPPARTCMFILEKEI